MKKTIYDVAEEAKVSIATVSKVINNKGRISDSTRKRVIEVMKKLDYHPSYVASALTGKRTETLGLLIPDISNPFFSEISRTIEDRAYEQGKSVIMCNTDNNYEKEAMYVGLLQRKEIDGLIITSGFQNKQLLQQLIQNDLPVVMLAHDDPSLDLSVVSVDDFKGGFIATSHLISKGHENIAIIAEKVRSSRMRIYGYQEAHDLENVKIRCDNILKVTASISNGQALTKKILERETPPTAIFACNDLIAIGVLKAAREKGLNVPEDLSVVGFDNTILATTTVPALTTVAQPIDEMGKKIVDIVIQKIEESKEVKERVLFVPKLIERGTTTTYKLK